MLDYLAVVAFGKSLSEVRLARNLRRSCDGARHLCRFSVKVEKDMKPFQGIVTDKSFP
jgi:hypothetical protein